jgi:hypothetical protein
MARPIVNHVILEGADGSGKTELAKHLVSCHQYHYYHEGPPPKHVENVADYYFGIIIGRAHFRTVFDRMFIGETVYGPKFRNESKITADQLTRLFFEFKRINGIVGLCEPTYDVVYRNVFSRESQTSFERDPIIHHQIYEAYRNLDVPWDFRVSNFSFDCQKILGEKTAVECDRWLGVASANTSR